jgi:hypothetical protein
MKDGVQIQEEEGRRREDSRRRLKASGAEKIA